MASWLQSRLRAAEGLLEAVDRTAKTTREQQGGTVKLEGLFGLSGGGNSHGDGAPSSAEPQSYLQPNGQSPGENGECQIVRRLGAAQGPCLAREDKGCSRRACA